MNEFTGFLNIFLKLIPRFIAKLSLSFSMMKSSIAFNAEWQHECKTRNKDEMKHPNEFESDRVS